MPRTRSPERSRSSTTISHPSCQPTSRSQVACSRASAGVETAPPLVQRVPITPAIAAEVARLPSTFHRDPADRVIVATAIVLGLTLLTEDSRILKARIVPTL
ncbi:MAG TPA: PIN domain-containing protein [Candidatus Bathyarchaeia archaeon]|nr:PIN domain-containing protein [Candidatus Bathyarchaeia archaeon]